MDSAEREFVDYLRNILPGESGAMRRGLLNDRIAWWDAGRNIIVIYNKVQAEPTGLVVVDHAGQSARSSCAAGCCPARDAGAAGDRSYRQIHRSYRQIQVSW